MMTPDDARGVAARVIAADRVANGESALSEDKQAAADLLAIARGARN